MVKGIGAPILIGILVVGSYIGLDSAYILDQNQQVVVVEFGKLVRTVKEPGLHFKVPFIQSTIYYDNRLLDHDVQPTEIVTKDKRTLVMDNFAKWRIINPERFYMRLKTEAVARDRIKDIIYSELRLDFGSHTLEEIVSTHRDQLMKQVTKRSNSKANDLNMGIEIVDVRIKRADLPPENQLAVFNRMREERKRIARQWRSEGKEEAQKIRALTEKEKVIILAEAYKKEQEIRGEGDAKSIAITAEAFGKDPDFYTFLRSLEAYKTSLTSRSTLILTQNSPFLKYMSLQ
ncbi:HflC protein [hydrothermal vent metagenome]|uniref:HflC protein n=1 Tax=hydrothermal vent metagenome TaxID=652676 RepID=A0A3B1D6S6_9ZZZZ